MRRDRTGEESGARPANTDGSVMADELFSDVPGNLAKVTSGNAGVWVRRTFIGLFTLLAALAVIGVFGQRTSTSSARTAGAVLTLSAPKNIRGGLFFESRVIVRATSRIRYPRLVLDEGWLKGIQVNSIEPAAMSESSRDGRLVLSYDTLAPGDVLKVWLQFEVVPNYRGTRGYGIEIYDQTRRLARVQRELRVWP
jgi:hypothetical protein